MSWWKQAKEIQDFEDRNLVNNSIRQLTSIADYLDYASILIYQTARGARQVVAELKENKTLSTYQDIRNMLVQADRYALDSPKKFAFICQQASKEIRMLASSFEDDRTEFSNKKKPKFKKGLVDE